MRLALAFLLGASALAGCGSNDLANPAAPCDGTLETAAGVSLCRSPDWQPYGAVWSTPWPGGLTSFDAIEYQVSPQEAYADWRAMMAEGNRTLDREAEDMLGPCPARTFFTESDGAGMSVETTVCSYAGRHVLFTYSYPTEEGPVRRADVEAMKASVRFPSA